MSQNYNTTNSNPKIYVMQLKELIYTTIFIILTIILIIILVSMFAPSDDALESSATAQPSTSANSTSTYTYYYN